MEKLLTPSAPFQAVRDGQFTMPRFVDIDLSSARTELTALEINIAGNVLYCDANPGDGNCIVEFNDVGSDSGTDTPFYVSPGFIANVPYTRIRVYNSAQPGKKVRLVYGVDIPFQPGSVANVAISSIGGFVSIRPEDHTGFYASGGALAANTAVQIIAPSANLNGIVILSADMQGYSATSAITQALISKSGPAPTTIYDGAVILTTKTVAAVSTASIIGGTLSFPQKIPAGEGLYVISNVATGVTLADTRVVRYKTL